MNGGHALMASAVVAASARITSAVFSGAIAVDNSGTADLATQVGVFGGCIAIGYFMLRRGDGRERDAAAAAQEREREVTAQAHADNKALRDEMAILRAEYLDTRDKLIAALTDNAKAHEQMASQATELAELRAAARRQDP